MREQRERLVAQLVASQAIGSDAVAEAFRTVPRHAFVPDADRAQAYDDAPVVTKRDAAGVPISSVSQPTIVAIMLEQLELHAGHRVLEIGAGSGYNAALLAWLVGPHGAVTSVDIDPELVDGARRRLARAGAQTVDVVCADGADGFAAHAPYDRVIVTAGAPDLPAAWRRQLVDGGRLVVPLSLGGAQRAVALERRGDVLASRSVVDCGFMPLRGALAKPTATIALEPGVALDCEHPPAIDADTIRSRLARPTGDHDTLVRTTSADAIGSLGLWLALADPRVARLAAFGGGAWPSVLAHEDRAMTHVLLGERGLAALVGTGRPDALAIAVRGYGDDDAASRLGEHVRAWDRAGRPPTSSLAIVGHPPATSVRADIIIDLPSCRLAVTWPLRGRPAA